MQPDVMIRRLQIRVDPADSSYMPAMIVVNCGESLTSLHELAAITIQPNDTIVTLLQNITEVIYYLINNTIIIL